MTNPDFVLATLVDDVATLTLNRPEKLNALSSEMLRAIPRLLHDAVDQGARAVLVTGAGRAFCTGAELGSAEGAMPGDLGETIREFYNPLALALAESPVPIVSAVNGPAAGAGASLALGADIVVAARSSYFLFAFANIGLVPDAGASWLLAKSVGRAKALEMALLGERLGAAEALAAGLVARVVDDEALAETAWELARKLAARPTMALGLIRKQIRQALDGSFADVLQIEREHQQRAGFSEDFAEGVRAFREKRPGVFTGR